MEDAEFANNTAVDEFGDGEIGVTDREEYSEVFDPEEAYLQLGNGFEYGYFSSEGSTFLGRARGFPLDEEQHVLTYDAADSERLEKYKSERNSILEKIRKELNFKVGEKMNSLLCFIAAIPTGFLETFAEWLEWKVSLESILAFFYVEIATRYFGRSASVLRKHSHRCVVSAEKWVPYEIVKAEIKRADIPNSEKRRSSGHFAPFSTDPVVPRMTGICQRYWSKIFFCAGETWIDLDDDKLPHVSSKWEKYGFKRTPTRDRIPKPVVHVAANVWTGHILGGWPEYKSSKLSDIT